MKVLACIIIFLNLLPMTFGAYLVDKPRKPTTMGSYIYILIISGVTVYLLWRAYL